MKSFMNLSFCTQRFVKVCLHKTLIQSLLKPLIIVQIVITIKMNEEMHNLYDALWGQQGSIITKLKVKVPQAKNGISAGYKMTIPRCVSRDLTESNFHSMPEEHSFKAIKLDSDSKAVLPCVLKNYLFIQSTKRFTIRLLKSRQEDGLEMGRRRDVGMRMKVQG